MIRGSCLCSSICYAVGGPLGPASHCHCSMCRKALGAAFGTYARAQKTIPACARPCIVVSKPRFHGSTSTTACRSTQAMPELTAASGRRESSWSCISTEAGHAYTLVQSRIHVP